MSIELPRMVHNRHILAFVRGSRKLKELLQVGFEKQLTTLVHTAYLEVDL